MALVTLRAAYTLVAALANNTARRARLNPQTRGRKRSRRARVWGRIFFSVGGARFGWKSFFWSLSRHFVREETRDFTLTRVAPSFIPRDPRRCVRAAFGGAVPWARLLPP